MVGRGALIKPWIFKEYEQSKCWFPTTYERVEVYYRLTSYFKEHFGSDDYGKRHSFYFLPWHFSFFSRFRPAPESQFRQLSSEIPLIQNSRIVDEILNSRELPDFNGFLDPKEKQVLALLQSDSTEIHYEIANTLWNSKSAEEAYNTLSTLSNRNLNLNDRDASRGTDRLDESSWELGKSGPRGEKTAVNDHSQSAIDQNTQSSNTLSDSQYVDRKVVQASLSNSLEQRRLQSALLSLNIRAGQIFTVMF